MDTDILNEGLTMGFDMLGTVLLALAAAYAPRIVRAIETKLGIKAPDGWEKRALDLAGVAVDYAEEWGRGKAREALEDTAVGDALSSEKLDKAAEFFQRHARGKLTKWGEEKVREVILAKLSDKRAQEAAAEKANAKALDKIGKDIDRLKQSASKFDLVDKLLRGEIKPEDVVI